MKLRRIVRGAFLRPRWLLAIVVLAAGTGAAGGQTVDVPNSVIAGGGGVSSNGSFRLTYSMGEPAAGITSNGTTTVTSGFLATFVSFAEGAPDGRIFADGFESN